MSQPLQDTEIEVDVPRARALMDDGALVVDVREPHEWEAGRIAGAVHIPMAALSGSADTLPRDRVIIFQCRVGGRSLMAAQAFRQAGFRACSMAGGLIDWRQAGLPLTPDDGVVADH